MKNDLAELEAIDASVKEMEANNASVKRWISVDENGKPTGGEVIGVAKPDDPRLVEVPMDFNPRCKKLDNAKSDFVADQSEPESWPDAPPSESPPVKDAK